MIDHFVLWKDFRNGDEKAFETLLHLFYTPLYEYGFRFQKDESRLQDALHDLMISLWERREHLNDTQNLRLYLFKSFRHQIFREKQQKAPLSIETEDTFLPIESSFFSESAEGEIIRNEVDFEKSAKIQHVLGKLTSRQQEILHLKFYENLSNEEIAELLQIGRPAVANLLYQASKLFRVHWNSELVLALLSFCHLV